MICEKNSVFLFYDFFHFLPGCEHFKRYVERGKLPWHEMWCLGRKCLELLKLTVFGRGFLGSTNRFGLRFQKIAFINSNAYFISGWNASVPRQCSHFAEEVKSVNFTIHFLKLHFHLVFVLVGYLIQKNFIEKLITLKYILPTINFHLVSFNSFLFVFIVYKTGRCW